MYYSIYTTNMLKKVFLIGIFILGTIFFIKSCSSSEKYNQERKELQNNVKQLQKKYDSLEAVSNKLKKDYDVYQISYIKDSLYVDSLKSVMNDQMVQTKKAEDKANFYLTKYSEMNKKIEKLKSNKEVKTGNNLLESLSGKIN